MEVKQVYTLLNTVATEILGTSEVVAEDLSNVVDVGTQLFNASSVDNYVKSLVNHIGKVIFVNRPYSGGAPSVMMDGWEYGSVLQKVRAALPAVAANDEWGLENGQTYNQDIFYKPTVSSKFYNKRITFEIPVSFAERQVKESFSSAEQLNGFFSMLYDNVDRAITVQMDALIMRTINNMTAETLLSEYPEAKYNEKSGVRAVNLLKLYNSKFSASLTPEAAITTPEFIRFASLTMGLYADRMGKMSKLFNVSGTEKFTPREYLHVVLLSDFKMAASAYLQSDTYHDMYTALPNAETVPYWQGSGTDYSFGSVSDIHVNTNGGKEVVASGILGVMFDRDALGVANLSRRVTTHYNAKAEFINNYYKFEAGYFNDLDENFVVFFVA